MVFHEYICKLIYLLIISLYKVKYLYYIIAISLQFGTKMPLLDYDIWFINCTFTREACSIQFDDYVIITGGTYSLDIVSNYTDNGWEKYLPNLLSGRYGHGCGHYTNENNELVIHICWYRANLDFFRSYIFSLAIYEIGRLNKPQCLCHKR